MGKTMTIITIDDELINEIIAVSHYENAQEAVIKILSNYLQQQKKELPLFERLRFSDNGGKAIAPPRANIGNLV